jgi:transcriptional regulator with XRE-family HTH domain
MSFTPAQCRAARGLLGWSQVQLAEASKVATKTIADFERESRTPYDRTLADVQRAFEAAGVEFTNGGQPGVRMRMPKPGDRVEFRSDLPASEPKHADKRGVVVAAPANNPADPTKVWVQFDGDVERAYDSGRLRIVSPA